MLTSGVDCLAQYTEIVEEMNDAARRETNSIKKRNNPAAARTKREPSLSLGMNAGKLGAPAQL